MAGRNSYIFLIAALALVVWRLGLLGGSHSGAGVGSGGGTSYVGTTSQGLPISFSATSNQVQSITFAWSASCADGQTHTNTIEVGGAPINSGSFTTSGTLNTGGLASVSGRITASGASGQLSRSGPTAFGTNCTDDGVTWTAHSTG